MVKRSRLAKKDNLPLRQKLKRLGKGIFVTLPWIYSGWFMKGRNPEGEDKKLAKLAATYGKVANSRLKEGWTVVPNVWKGYTFKKGNLELIQKPYTVHVHYLEQHLYEAEYDRQSEALGDFLRIFADDRMLADYERQGREWIFK